LRSLDDGLEKSRAVPEFRPFFRPFGRARRMEKRRKSFLGYEMLGIVLKHCLS
jgi:hypothetical protein